MVFLVPGRITASGLPSSAGDAIYRRDTASSRSRALKSVKLEIRGSRTTAISSGAFLPLRPKRAVRESSSSRSTVIWGTTPTTGMPVRSSSIFTPGSRMVLSPRKLLIIRPLTMARSSGSSRATVP